MLVAVSEPATYIVRFRAVVQGDRAVVLSRQQAMLFEAIARRDGFATVRRLAGLIDPDGHLDNAGKQVAIVVHRIRRRLSEQNIDIGLITQWGRGYALRAPIEIDDIESPAPLTVAATRLLKRLIERVRDQEPALTEQVSAAVFDE